MRVSCQILKYSFLCLAGIFLTRYAVTEMYTIRGYFAYGGEWLILPLLIMTSFLIDGIKDTVKNIFKKEGKSGFIRWEDL